jgi:hypothetical protein
LRPVVAILAALVLVALLVLLIMANNRGFAPSSSEPPRLLSLPVYESSGGSDAALIQGELEVRGRCLLLVTAEDTVGVAWPMPGTRWDASTATIEVRGTTARVGERVELGGSGVLVTPRSCHPSDGLDRAIRGVCLKLSGSPV